MFFLQAPASHAADDLFWQAASITARGKAKAQQYQNGFHETLVINHQ